MKFKNRGISRVVPVVILIVIVAIAAIAYYSLTSAPKTSSTSSASTSSLVSSSSQSSTPSSTTSSTTTTMTSSPSSTTSTESSTTASSPSSTTSTSSTTSSETSATCVTAFPSNSTEGQELVGWFGNYTSLTIGFEGIKNGKTADLNFTYTIVYASPTTFKVNLNIIFNGKARVYTLWDLRNGTVLALLLPNGENDTGYAASNIVLGYFSDLEALDTIALQSTNAYYFKPNGTSTVTIGTNSFTVSNYVANTTNETILGCNNSGSGTLSNYSVNLGTPSGSSFELVVSANFAGSLTDASGTTTFDYTYQVTGFTIA